MVALSYVCSLRCVQFGFRFWCMWWGKTTKHGRSDNWHIYVFFYVYIARKCLDWIELCVCVCVIRNENIIFCRCQRKLKITNCDKQTNHSIHSSLNLIQLQNHIWLIVEKLLMIECRFTVNGTLWTCERTIAFRQKKIRYFCAGMEWRLRIYYQPNNCRTSYVWAYRF